MDEVIVYTDIETGGLEYTRPIIQIAAVAVDAEFHERGCIELKVAFNRRTADPTSLSTNKFDAEVWRRESVPPVQAAHRFATFLRRHSTVDMQSRDGRHYSLAQLAGHNAERFDGPFIHAWYQRLGVFCPARYMTLCTKQKALWLFAEDKSLTPPADFKLGTLCQYFGVNLSADAAHDAMNDVRATVQLYQAMRRHENQRLARAA